jgi:predicted nucleotidyltransferase
VKAALEQDTILSEIVQRLVAALQPEKIFLFGSKARGDDNFDSDYDLMVVVSSSDLPGYKRDQAAHALLYGVRAAKDIIVMTHDEFERKRTVVCSLPATVEREGRLLYAK